MISLQRDFCSVDSREREQMEVRYESRERNVAYEAHQNEHSYVHELINNTNHEADLLLSHHV